MQATEIRTALAYLQMLTYEITDFWVQLGSRPAGTVPNFRLGDPEIGFEPWGEPELGSYNNWPDELKGMTYERGWRYRAQFSDGSVILDKLELRNPGENGTYYVYVINDRVVFISRPWMAEHMGPYQLGE